MKQPQSSIKRCKINKISLRTSLHAVAVALVIMVLSSNTSHGFTIPSSPATLSTTLSLHNGYYHVKSQLKLSAAKRRGTFNNDINGSNHNGSNRNSTNNNDNEESQNHAKHNLNNNSNNITPDGGIQMSPSKLQHEVKKYKAQAEIDAILNDPEGPFDLESELKKVTQISPPIPSNSMEQSVEDNLYKMESEMYNAVHTHQDYDLAQKKKQEIDQMHIDDCGTVLSTNAAFYKAFSNKDYEMMDDLWLHDACAVCIHPSQKPIYGANAVLTSWKKIFEAGNDGFQKNKIVPTNIKLCVKGTTATVTCDEEVYTRRFVRGKKRNDGNDGMELVNKLTATNILRKVGGKWYIMQHHASWHHESDAAKKAMSAQMNVNDIVDSSKDGEGSSTVEGLLGIPGHLGLGGEKKKAAERKGPVRRVFTGSLSDLLGGGLNDILKGDMDDNEGEIDNDDDLEDEDDDEEDDEDSDDEEIIIANMMVNGGIPPANKPKIIALNGQGHNGIVQSQKDPKKDKKESNKENTRQKCIATLRKLANKGIISQKHKRMLLTDIITSSSKGESSLVEIAYDLLCGEGSDEDIAEEEFAEQCQVFVASLPEVLN